MTLLRDALGSGDLRESKRITWCPFSCPGFSDARFPGLRVQHLRVRGAFFGVADLESSNMPWLQAVQPPKGDDVFDEEADDMHISQQEWKSTMEKRVKEGYRDGIDAGKADSLQQGFNEGYREGLAVLMASGTLKGCLWALKCWSCLLETSSYLSTEIDNLLQAVGRLEESASRSLATTSLQPHPGELADSIKDMSLNQSAGPREHSDSKEGRSAECCSDAKGFPCKRSDGPSSAPPECCRKAQEALLKKLVSRTLSVAKDMNMSEELMNVLQSLKK